MAESFKGEGLQQTNALLPYWEVPRPISGISCDVENCCPYCGDIFSLMSNLALHLERRTIKLPCDTCQVTKVFYNRCNLLSHVRSHIINNEIVDISRAVADPLPHGFMDRLRSTLTNTLEDSNSIPPTELLELTVKEIDQTSTKVRQEFIFPKVKCLDCNKEFENLEARKKHLTNNDEINPLTIFKCNICGMVCPSKCHVKAHLRMHFQVSPYVCPECGDCSNFNWTNFLQHVMHKCFHTARGIGYKCPVCKHLFLSTESLLKHMELHTEKYIKCLACIRVIFSSLNGFKNHVNEFHTDNTTNIKYREYYKCPLCNMMSSPNNQIPLHCSTHLGNQVCEYIFNCMQCGKNVKSKVLLLEHIKLSHASRKIREFSAQGEDLQEQLKAKRRLVHPKAPINLAAVQVTKIRPPKPRLEQNKCAKCDFKSTDRKAFKEHLVTHKKYKNTHQCQECGFCFVVESALAKHLRIIHKISDTKKYLEEESSNFIPDTGKAPDWIICFVCFKTFTNEIALKAHKRSHGMAFLQSILSKAAY